MKARWNSAERELSTENPDTKNFEWWWGAWRGFIRCPECRALMSLDAPCPVCAKDYRNAQSQVIIVDGREIHVPNTYNGPLDWSPYVMLKLMHREWLRPATDGDSLGLPDREPSPHVLVVLLFWTYFETLMTWFYETATHELPTAVQGDLLTRYSSIGSRRDRLHRVLFSTRHDDDLDQLGYTDVRRHLEKVQVQRNAFMHGNPEAIADALVLSTVDLMPRFHEAWINSFNLRCARRPKK